MFDPTDPTAGVGAYLVGDRLGEDFGKLLEAFMAERLLPLAKELAELGQDPKELLRAFAGLVRSSADAIEANITP